MNFSDSDKFYSGFPSYGEHESKRNALAKARQLEYQTFLLNKNKGKPTPTKNRHGRQLKQAKQIATRENGVENGYNEKLIKKEAISTEMDHNEENTSNGLTVREKYVKKLEKMSAPDIFNDVRIDARNRQFEEEKRIKQLQYHLELKAQIDDKKREKELQEAIEIEKEVRLNRKVKAQQKLLKLQEDHEMQRRIKNESPINIHVTPPSPTASMQIRSEPQDLETYRSYYDHFVANTKENANNKKVYKFFTNSARYPNELSNTPKILKNNRSPTKLQQKSPNKMDTAYNTYPARKANTTNHQQSPQSKRPLCNFCKEKRLLGRSQIENITNGSYICGSCEDIPICLKCRQEICSRCKQPIKVAKHSNRSNDALTPRKTNSNEQLNSNTAELKLSPLHLDSFRVLETTDDDEIASNGSSRPPYSFNIKETSIFHPSNSLFNTNSPIYSPVKSPSKANLPFDELKRITEEKLMKYSRNYKDLMVNNNGFGRNNMENVDSFPMPLMRDNLQETPPVNAGPSSDGNSNAFKRVQTKWQVPAVQKNTIALNFDTNTRTLTQIGAFKKQLQLDKFNFGDDIRDPSPRP